ncbi:MAG: MFS transporter [Clostridiales bacterium]|nr:MFS transporter [Clostridiales bacterium]
MNKILNIKFINQYIGLPKSIYMVAIARMLIIMGHFVYPFMTLYLTTRFGYTTEEVGQYILLLSLVYIPGALIGSNIADKVNRKVTFCICMILADLFFVVCGFLYQSEVMLIPLVAAFFFLNSAFPILTSMVMDMTTPSNRQESFSLISIGLNLGFAIGPSLASLLFENYAQWLFFGQAMLNFSAVLLVIFFIKDTRPTKEDIAAVAAAEDRALEQASSESFLKLIFKSPIIMGFILGAAAIAFIYAQFFYMMPLQLNETFGTTLGSRYYGTTCFINGAGIVILAPFMVMLTKKFNPLFNMAVAAVLYAVGFGLYGSTNIWTLFMLFAVIWTSGEVLVSANISVFLANHAPITHRARFQSLYDITHAVGKAIGPLILGTYLMTHTYADAWRLVALLGVAAALLFSLLGFIETRKMKKQTEQK